MKLVAILISICIVALSGRFDVPIPGSPIPQSAQTLAVLMVGAFLGARNGVLALLGYLLLGGLGIPVFADGASGWRHLLGPSSGYLVGFVVAAGAVGWLAEHDRIRKFLPAFAAMVGGHILILGLGWARLGTSFGFVTAFTKGVSPFLWGGLSKSIVAAIFAVLYLRYSTLSRSSEPCSH